MRAVCVVALGLSILAPGCAKKAPAAAHQGGGQGEPRITLEDVERARAGGGRYDRGVISLGVQEAGAEPGAGPAGVGPVEADVEGEEGGPEEGGEGAGDEVAEEGEYEGADLGEGDETLANDEGDEAI